MPRPKTLTDEQMRENSRNGGVKSQSLEFQAVRIARRWPELSPSQKSIIRTILSPVLVVRTRGPNRKAARSGDLPEAS